MIILLLKYSFICHSYIFKYTVNYTKHCINNHIFSVNKKSERILFHIILTHITKFYHEWNRFKSDNLSI